MTVTTPLRNDTTPFGENRGMSVDGQVMDTTQRLTVQRPTITNQPVACLLTREDAAALLKVSTDTIDRLVKAGTLPYVRVGSQIRFTMLDVHDFIDAHRAGPAR